MKEIIKFKSKRAGIISSVLALAAVVLLIVFKDVFYDKETFCIPEFIISLICTPLCLILPALKLNRKDDMHWNTAAFLLLAAVPFICMWVSIIMADSQIEGALIYIYNVIIYFFVGAILLFITRSSRVTATVLLSVNVIYHIINSLVVIARGLPIAPSDIYAWRTALIVSSNYDLTINYEMITGFVLTLLTVILIFKLPVKFSRKRVKNTVMMSSAAALILAGFISISTIDCDAIDFNMFDLYVSNSRFGVPLNLYHDFQQMSIDKPEGYSASNVEAMIDEAAEAANTGSEAEDIAGPEKKLPNIIVVMDESFSDILPESGYVTDVDPMPFYNSLTENTISGEILVSTYGGGTCNTEFEFLTGMTTGLLPRGTFPYQQYVKRSTPSLVSHLKSLGYTATAYHPYWGYSWNRTMVYNYFGFDKFISAGTTTDSDDKSVAQVFSKIEYETFTDGIEPIYVRSYISDLCAFQRVERDFEERDKDKPWFSFLVTMQNHGAYNYDNEKFPSTVHVLNSEEDCSDAEQYLTLISESDKAYAQLIDYFANCGEDTIILFFGDHQPELAVSSNDDDDSDEEITGLEQLQKYISLFKIWANFDIPDQYVGLTSASYLSQILLDAAGIEQPAHNEFLREMRAAFPAITVFGAVDSEGTWYPYSTLDSYEAINKYRQFIYYTLFD